MRNPKETLMSHEIPERPWQKIGVDLMKGKDYLITTDYRSNFWEIDALPNILTKTVISKLKPHFARYDIPDVVVSDNGPQFDCDEFRYFASKYGFEHTPSSPHHSQSNGKAESLVKVAKRMIRKCRKSGEDQYLALLSIRNTPTQGVGTSPAQRFLGRRTRTTLPIMTGLLTQEPVSPRLDTLQLKHNQQRQEKYYNRAAHDLPELMADDVVRMQPFKLGEKSWWKAQVLSRLDQRSYEVQAEDGAVYHRNRRHPKGANEPPLTDSPMDLDRASPQNVLESPVPNDQAMVSHHAHKHLCQLRSLWHFVSW